MSERITTNTNRRTATDTDRGPSNERYRESVRTDGSSADGGPKDPNSAAARWMSVEDVRAVYAENADRMARIAGLNRLLTGRYRRDLFGRAEGRTLDVASGLGMNLRYLPESVEYTGIDISPEMLERAEARHDRLERGENLLEMDAQDLEFPDDSFDTVISSLSTCTFPEPVTALREMARVCRPDGRILLLEHGRSDVGPIAHLLDRRADAHYEAEGCRWNQEPLALVTRAELSVRDVTTGLLGILTAIDAAPPDHR